MSKSATVPACLAAPTGRACRVCGCTEQAACPGGCAWVEADLCSACRALLARGGEAELLRAYAEAHAGARRSDPRLALYWRRRETALRAHLVAALARAEGATVINYPEEPR